MHAAVLRPGGENRILSNLPSAELSRLAPHLEPVPLHFGETLFQAGEPIECVYFPQRGLLSLLSTTEEGETVEVAFVGTEGVVGFLAANGPVPFPYQVTVQLAGEAIRMGARKFLTEIRRKGGLCEQLFRFLHPFIFQLSQTGVCNRFHSAEARFCRWLLHLHDYAESDTLPLTQEFLAHTLGVHRNAISLVGGELQAKGLIRYTRGRITVLNRPAIEATACECYRLIKAAYTGAIPG